jgi:DedD protein
MNQLLKQRLVGAVVLVSLAVIFIPIILEGPDDEWSPRTQGMPEPPQIAYQAEGDVELPLPAEEPPEDMAPEPVSATAESQPPPPVDAGTPAAIKPSSGAEPAATAPAPAQPVRESPPPAPAASGDWAIQVGRFSQRLNAQGLRDRLKKAGYAAFLREDKTDSGQSWRVLVGPLKTRGDAEKIRDELASKRQLKGFVIQNNG